MRVAFVQRWHGEKMGYIDNFLPRAMAAFGHDVHLVTSNVQPYFDLPSYRETYEPYFGPPFVPCGVPRREDNVTLHRLPHGWLGRRLRIRGLYSKLAELRPDVVQGFEVDCVTTYEAALYKPLLRYELFLESHIHASVFSPARGWLSPRSRLRWAMYRNTIGAFLNLMTRTCYPISTDAADIAIRFFGISPRKVALGLLGTDTHMFRPALSSAEKADRCELRRQLGFSDSDIVCIYTGRMTEGKGPTVLAEAIKRLRSNGQPFSGLFVGHGAESYIEVIGRTPACVLHPFVPTGNLPPLYRAADIAVWPKQESTSQLDAAAAGLPLILSDRVQVTERIDGNGLMYHEGDSEDLASKIRSLKDIAVRQTMGAIGRRRMVQEFDWMRLARQRLADYEAALSAKGRSVSGRHAANATPLSVPVDPQQPRPEPDRSRQPEPAGSAVE